MPYSPGWPDRSVFRFPVTRAVAWPGNAVLQAQSHPG
jgi:hypothetical protein